MTMKIDYSSQKAQMDAYLKNTAQVQQKPEQQQEGRDAAVKSQTPQRDRVELSSGSRLLQKVNSAMRAEEPGRAEKVNMLKEQIQNGTYEVKPEKIADSMLKDMIKNLG